MIRDGVSEDHFPSYCGPTAETGPWGPVYTIKFKPSPPVDNKPAEPPEYEI
jgi:hypothetical protein